MMSAGPALANSLREAARSLSRARLRTVLGLVGIAIGIASVIAMVSAGEVAKAEARKRFEALGTDIVTVQTAEGYQGPGIRLDDALALAGSLDAISTASPTVPGPGGFVHAGKRVGSGSMIGVAASYADLLKLEVAEGRFVSDLDAGRPWAVAGAKVAAAIRRAGTLDVLEAEIEIDGRFYGVAGVLEARERTFGSLVDVDADQSVFVPAATARRVTGDPGVETIVARAAPGVHHEDAVAAVAAWFRERDPGLGLEVSSAKQLIEQMESQLGVMTLLLSAVGSISLVVGGIGVMNIMLISVTERRREIGVRRALGASRGDVMRQFLVEALILTLAGGLAGLAIGSAVTWGICDYTGWEYFVSGRSAAVGLGVSSAAGLFFGFQPAWQASRLDPIVALQGE